jgi:hypothetical protein
LFAMEQTEDRQSAWFQSFVLWFCFDFVIASTGAVLVTHLLIPLYVMSDIRTIKRKVLGDIVSYREKQLLARRKVIAARGSVERPSASPIGASIEFNAARYLFTSWRVAALFPELPESQLILQFETPWKEEFPERRRRCRRPTRGGFPF